MRNEKTPDATVRLSYLKLPAKKNTWRRGINGRMYLPGEVRRAIEALTWQAKAQWCGRQPLENPAVQVELHLSDLRRDIDGIWTTILDALQAAGVIRQDNAAHFGGPVAFAPVRYIGRGQTEEVIIRIWREWPVEMPKGAHAER